VGDECGLGRLDPRRLHEVEGEHAHAITRGLLANRNLEVRRRESRQVAATQPLHSLRDDLPRCVKAVYKELNASRGHAIAARNIAAEVRFSSPLERLRAHREVALPSRESWAEGLGGR